MSRPVALAKISRPRLHDVLPRTRLHAWLDAVDERPVVWLCAQPGAGKTTLVASHLEARRRGGIWYQVDAADADPASFVYHLRLAADALGAAAKRAALPPLTPEYLQDLRGYARRFFRALYERLGNDAALVLDNFQEVDESSAFHRLVVEAMAEVPPGVHVVVLSRVEPPAAYAPLLATGAIAVLDGAELRLAPEETTAIAQRRGIVDAAAVTQLHERSHGWAAGLTLLLTPTRRGHAAGATAGDDEEALQHVFAYFAERVLGGLAEESQRTLMALAWLPQPTSELATALSGHADAGRLLEQLYRRHLFVDRRRVGDGRGPATTRHAYQLHALLRTFLRHRARSLLGEEDCRALATRAAALLEADGQPEAALALHAEAADWARYAALLATQAEGWLAHGRAQTLLGALDRLPVAERAGAPWLDYWEGRARAGAAPETALRLLERGHARFAEAGDAAGRYACGAAAVQTLWYARLGWSEIGPWVERLEGLFEEAVDFPTPAVELLSRSALHAALAFCRPAHPAIRGLGMRLVELVDDERIDWDPRLAAATHLITWLHNAVEIELAQRLVARVDPQLDARPASALNRAFWLVFRAIHDLRQARAVEAAERFDRAEALAHAEGLKHAEFAALQFHAYLDVVSGDVDAARLRVARMETHPARGHPDAEMNYHVVRTLLFQREGDARRAHGEAQLGLAAIRRVQAAYFQAVFPALLASAYADAGEQGRALELLAASRALSAGSYLEAMEAQLCLEEAYVAWSRGDRVTLLERLGAGIGLAAREPRRAAYVHRIVARKPVLLAEALKAGIEVDTVRRFVRLWHLPAPRDEEIAAWPWPVRVYTLGRFEVLVDDAPIAFGRKAPKKTLALLKAVVARGGQAPESALVDTFWPDEDGDAAMRSLGAAVHRLRGLLGSADAVVQQGGLVALDGDRVWVDAQAFERALGAAREPAAVEAALGLYRGAFLAEEEGEAWPVALRERLRSRFIQAVAAHAAALEAQGRDLDAIAWYLRGLDADDVVEPFYQGLMRCYHRLDRLPEAVSAYRRLKQTLSVTLSLPPSAGTEKLYRSLRLA